MCAWQKKQQKKLVSLGKMVLAADGRVEDEYAGTTWSIICAFCPFKANARAKYADRIKKNNNSGALHMNIVTFV